MNERWIFRKDSIVVATMIEASNPRFHDFREIGWKLLALRNSNFSIFLRLSRLLIHWAKLENLFEIGYPWFVKSLIIQLQAG